MKAGSRYDAEQRVERFSYPVITPSAARGIFDAIYWDARRDGDRVRPYFHWQITRIEALELPRYIALRLGKNSPPAPNRGSGLVEYQPSRSQLVERAMGRRYKQGTARSQFALLPPRIEDYVGEDNTARAIDADVETLDLDALGFRNAGGCLAPGQPAFPPGLYSSSTSSVTSMATRLSSAYSTLPCTAGSWKFRRSTTLPSRNLGMAYAVGHHASVLSRYCKRRKLGARLQQHGKIK